MKNPTNSDLHIMLVRIEERQKTVVDKLDGVTQWQTRHEEKDEKRFGDLNKYGRSIAIVASIFGAGIAMSFQAGIEWFKNKVS